MRGSYDGLPPLFVHVSSIETLLDDSTEIAARAQAAGVDVIIEQVPDVVHVWHALGREVPEASAGIDRVCAYIRSQCG
jgi:acetyl esterase/lipase